MINLLKHGLQKMHNNAKEQILVYKTMKIRKTDAQKSHRNHLK